jgi:hypothetical protein
MEGGIIEDTGFYLKVSISKKVHSIAFSADDRIREIVHCIAVHSIESKL